MTDGESKSKTPERPAEKGADRSSRRGSGRRRSKSRSQGDRDRDRSRDKDRNRDRSSSSSRRPKKMRAARKISDHFSRKDFSCRCGECQEALRLSLGLVGGLELLRSKSQHRINILKGYMCQTSAEKVGKVRRNFHAIGVAADITIDDLSPKDVFQLALDIPEFMGIGLADDHVHVDTRKENDRIIWIEKEGEIEIVSADTIDQYLEPSGD